MTKGTRRAEPVELEASTFVDELDVGRDAPSSVTRLYAAILAALHVLIAVAWITDKQIARLLTTEDAVCWPFFPSCQAVRGLLSTTGVYAAVAVYASGGVLSAALFATRRTRAGTLTFVATTLLGLALYALDYRLRTNQSYMFAWIVATFLVARSRVASVYILLPLFYVWAGTLKLGEEWLSGSALYARPLFVPASLVPASCAYVLVLELVFVWGLFSTRGRWRWLVYAHLVLFHLVSWSVVGFFYPLLMLGLTSIFPLVWILGPNEIVDWRRLRGEDRRRALSIAALFSVFQLVPHLFPGDTSVTGEGRLFALHMFDARVECEGGATLRSPSGETSHVELIAENEAVRVRCDPIVLRANARNLCRKLANRWSSVRVDVAVDAKRSSEQRMRPLMHVEDICRTPPSYSILHHNAWIGRP